MKRLSIVCSLLLVSLWISACGRNSPDVNATLPTRTPRPTFTPTTGAAPAQPVAIATDTPVPAAAPGNDSLPPADTPPPANPEPQPTATAAGAIAVINSPQVNLRAGPGTQYSLAGEATRGTEFRIVGKNSAGDWWQICCMNDATVWIAAFLVDTSGPVDSVAVAADLPAPPPTATPRPVVAAPTAAPAPAQPTATPAPAQPTEPPAPAFVLSKGTYIEPRVNSNPIVTFFGTICKKVCPQGGAQGGYTMVVEGPHGRVEGAFEDIFRNGDPGLPTEFIYNVKIEIPNGQPGAYRAYVVDASGNPVSEAWEYTASGGLRTFLPRWVAP